MLASLRLIAALSILWSSAAVCQAGEYKIIADQSAHVDEMTCNPPTTSRCTTAWRR